MYGSGAYRPLHHPEPRRRDRRAGARSAMRDAALNDAHEWAGRDPAPRPPGEKRGALARLRRRRDDPPSRAARALVVAGAVGLAFLAGRALLASPGADPTPYPDAREAYAALATHAEAACPERRCVLSLDSPFPIVADAVLGRMRALGVERVRVEPAAARVTFEGGRGAAFRVVVERPGVPEAAEGRAANVRWMRDRGVEVVAHGDGWRHEIDP